MCAARAKLAGAGRLRRVRPGRTIPRPGRTIPLINLVYADVGVYSPRVMPEYRRPFAPGARFFFTVVTACRRPILTGEALDLLRTAFSEERAHHAFEMDAVVVLPEHLHCIWTLPPDDTRFSMRWSGIKGRFTELYLAQGGTEARRSASRRTRNERGVWQRRFWDHVIRDEADYQRHVDYIHYNPVKHGYARCPHSWGPSSFDKWITAGVYPADWMCECAGVDVKPPDFGDVEGRAGE